MKNNNLYQEYNHLFHQMQNQNKTTIQNNVQNEMIKSYTEDVHHMFLNMFENNIQIPVNTPASSQPLNNTNINANSSQNQKSED